MSSGVGTLSPGGGPAKVTSIQCDRIGRMLEIKRGPCGGCAGKTGAAAMVTLLGGKFVHQVGPCCIERYEVAA